MLDTLLFAGIDALREYLALHVLLCLIPAFFLAGVIMALLPSEFVASLVGGNSISAHLISSISGSLMYF